MKKVFVPIVKYDEIKLDDIPMNKPIFAKKTINYAEWLFKMKKQKDGN